MKMNAYCANRSGEEPGILFHSPSPIAAKAMASRALEAGAFAGQVITLTELFVDKDGILIRTDRMWRKSAGGKWRGFGEA